MEETLKNIIENAELAAKLQKAWKDGATASELAQIVAAEGIEIDAAQVEEALAGLQSNVADAICDQEVDEDELAKVAGGGSGVNCSRADDCDYTFKKYQFMEDPTDRCYNWYVCDQYFAAIAG